MWTVQESSNSSLSRPGPSHPFAGAQFALSYKVSSLKSQIYKRLHATLAIKARSVISIVRLHQVVSAVVVHDRSANPGPSCNCTRVRIHGYGKVRSDTAFAVVSRSPGGMVPVAGVDRRALRHKRTHVRPRTLERSSFFRMKRDG